MNRNSATALTLAFILRIRSGPSAIDLVDEVIVFNEMSCVQRDIEFASQEQSMIC